MKKLPHSFNIRRVNVMIVIRDDSNEWPHFLRKFSSLQSGNKLLLNVRLSCTCIINYINYIHYKLYILNIYCIYVNLYNIHSNLYIVIISCIPRVSYLVEICNWAKVFQFDTESWLAWVRIHDLFPHAIWTKMKLSSTTMV